jgi:hypothetical protein
MPRYYSLIFLLLAFTSCMPLPARTVLPPSAAPATSTSLPPATIPPPATQTQSPTQPVHPTASQAAPVSIPSVAASPTQVPSLTPDTRLKPQQWQDWPVLPALSARARSLYQAGLAQGNNPKAFSKIGDCQNITSHFLGAFDDPQLFKLGARYESLQATINQFKGSFNRESAAVRPGFNVAAVLSPLQADPTVCQAGENPVACELRLNKPSIAVISMETWWAKKPADEYEKYMRQILDIVIAKKVLPILATKADNLEGDGSVNAILAKLAYEYDIPLWNFWKAVQPLPGGGLTEDGFHLSHASDSPEDPLFNRRLSEPAAMNFGWPMRNITALQALEAVWRAASQP